MAALPVFLVDALSYTGPMVQLPRFNQKTVSLWTSDVCVGHNPGPQHPEQPARLTRLLRAMREEWVPQFGASLQVYEPKADVTAEQLLRVHREQCARVCLLWFCCRLCCM